MSPEGQGPLEIWDAKPAMIAVEPPDFDAAPEVVRGRNTSRWQEATVLVKTEMGHGSGAVISPEGWILTNYHVVAPAVQLAAVHGEVPVRVQIITCEVTDRRTQRREKALLAEVYRADPVRDLALLKLLDLPSGIERLPHFELAEKNSEILDECLAIGSPGGGPAWSVRPGEIIKAGEFPWDFTDYVVYGDMTGAQLERTNYFGLVSNCPVSPGDSGGPLIGENGELLGLTVGTSVNASVGSIGYHIDLSEIEAFLDPLPKDHEEIPLDPWTGGLPFAVKVNPSLQSMELNGKTVRSLQFLHCMKENLRPIANQIYLDFDAKGGPTEDEATALDYLPTGLWGFESRGAFSFDAFVLHRFLDGVVVTGYTNAAGLVDEIRIDSDWDRISDVVWHRGETGSWTRAGIGAGGALVNEERLSETEIKILGQYLPAPGEQEEGQEEPEAVQDEKKEPGGEN